LRSLSVLAAAVARLWGRARENNLAAVLFAVAGAYFGFAVVARPPAI
jgi:hypothetical protein